MKANKIIDRIESALWDAGRSFEPLAGGPQWQAGIMAALRRIGPLSAQPPARSNANAAAWSWAAAVAACLAIGIGWYAFKDLNTDAVLAGLFLDDQTSLSVNVLLAEM